jgi:hypothetical protein
MKATVCVPILALVCGAACAASEPSAKDPSSVEKSSGATSRQPADEGARQLTKSECDSLGEWLADACTNRPNSRSAQIDGWCGDMIHNVHDGSWAADDCAKHIKVVDSMCFRSTTIVQALMDCDNSVSRP